MKDEDIKYKVLDLFCGAGGLSLGFKMADFDIIGGIDFDQEALDTHALNFKDGYHYCGDISELDDDFVLNNFDGKVDVIIGGPPCQGFSVANMQQKDIECDEGIAGRPGPHDFLPPPHRVRK